MSIDPASHRADVPAGTILLDSLDMSADHVYAFDFDGVVSSSIEDDIYHLQTWPGETELLLEAAFYFRIRCGAMEPKYQRHLLYQASAFRLGIDIAPGPAIAQVAKAAITSRLFILTARSGWYAVERMRIFLSRRNIIPIEIYNVGRVTKDRQIALLCREFPADQVYYVEDNPAHLAAVAAIGHPNLQLVLAQRTAGERFEMLQQTFIKTVRAAIAGT
jgi:hypothetical protein